LFRELICHSTDRTRYHGNREQAAGSCRRNDSRYGRLDLRCSNVLRGAGRRSFVWKTEPRLLPLQGLSVVTIGGCAADFRPPAHRPRFGDRKGDPGVAGERIQRPIESLLDEAEGAIGGEDRETSYRESSRLSGAAALPQPLAPSPRLIPGLM